MPSHRGPRIEQHAAGFGDVGWRAGFCQAWREEFSEVGTSQREGDEGEDFAGDADLSEDGEVGA